MRYIRAWLNDHSPKEISDLLISIFSNGAIALVLAFWTWLILRFVGVL
jgi:hypothetical protein